MHNILLAEFFFQGKILLAPKILSKKIGHKQTYNAKNRPNGNLWIPLRPLLLPAAARGPGPRVSSLLFGDFYFIFAIWTPFLNY